MKYSWPKIKEVFSYMLHRKGFFTKRLVISPIILGMLLYADIKSGFWNGMSIFLLVMLTLFIVCNYIIRYTQLKSEDEDIVNDDVDVNNEITPNSASLDETTPTEDNSSKGECLDDTENKTQKDNDK